MKKNLPRILIGILILLGLIGHAAKWYQIPLISLQDAFFYDARLRSTMPGGVDDRIVIIDLDEKSLAEVGRWPWGRDRMSTLVDRLFDQYKVSVLGFDVVFAEPDDSSGLKVLEQLGQKRLHDNEAFLASLGELRPQLDYDRRFVDSLKNRPVVLGYHFTNQDGAGTSGLLPPPVLPAGTFAGRNLAITHWNGYGANLPEFQKAAASAGHFVPLVDPDGVSRRIPLLAEHGGKYYEALSLAIVRVLLGKSEVVPGFVKDGGKDYGGLEWLDVKTARGVLRIPVDEYAGALVPFRGFQGSFRYVSAADVLAGRLPAKDLEGKIAIVGTTAPGLLDLRSSPVGGAYPGVEMHANMIAGMLDASVKVKPAYIIGAEATLLGLCGILLIFLLPRLSPFPATMVCLGVLVVVVVTGYGTWSYGIVMPMAAGLWLVIALFALNMAWGYFVESKSKRQFTDLFGQYVPPELVDQMARDPERYSMEGRSVELTVLFSDVRSFTTLSEGLEPKELTELMNTYLGAMTEVIRGRLGTLDKYIGDAIMAFWGAPVSDPDHARNAVLAAMEMQVAVRKLDEPFKARGWKPLHIGVGVNTGMMTVGDMGSHVRKAYTVMGDAVNLGSRLEGITKQYGVSILVGETTRNAIKDMVFREIDRVRVVGKEHSVGIFEPIGLSNEVSKEQQDELKLWQQALRAYRGQDWDQTDMLLLNLRRIAPGAKLYELYERRVAQLRKNPPGAGWDGVTTFDTK
jgi:adenylate cyclase